MNHEAIRTLLKDRLGVEFISDQTILDVIELIAPPAPTPTRVPEPVSPLSRVTIDEIAAHLHPELFSDDPIVAHRAASPFHVIFAQQSAVSAVAAVFEARNEIALKKEAQP